MLQLRGSSHIAVPGTGTLRRADYFVDSPFTEVSTTLLSRINSPP